MDKFRFRYLLIGLIAFVCVTSANAQQVSAPQQAGQNANNPPNLNSAQPNQPSASGQSGDLQNFLKAYGSHPLPTTKQEPATQQQPQQSTAQPNKQPQASSSEKQIPPTTNYQPQFPNEPYKSLNEKSRWNKLMVPSIAQQAQSLRQDEINYQQTQSNQQGATQTQTNATNNSTANNQTQQTSGHYNIFR